MKQKESNFISAVVYIHNNENNICQFIDGLLNVIEHNFKSYEIVCVDDNSEDQSVHVLKEYIKNSPIESTINLVSLKFFHGVELAMNAGIDICIGDFVFEFDCLNVDFDWNLVMDIYYKELEGYDITGAAPKLRGRWGSKIFYKLLAIGNKDIPELTTESFRLVSRRAINRVKTMNTVIPFRQVAYATSGLNYTSVCYRPLYTKYKLENNYRRNLAINLILVFTDICENMALVLAFLTALWSGIQLIKKEENGGNKLLLSSFFLMISIIIKYLKIINELIFKKQNYIVSNVEKINNCKE